MRLIFIIYGSPIRFSRITLHCFREFKEKNKAKMRRVNSTPRSILQRSVFYPTIYKILTVHQKRFHQCCCGSTSLQIFSYLTRINERIKINPLQQTMRFETYVTMTHGNWFGVVRYIQIKKNYLGNKHLKYKQPLYQIVNSFMVLEIDI